MSIEQAKAIPIAVILEKIAHKPTKLTAKDAWYLAPWRDEKTASLKVNHAKNIWYDFGEGFGGDGIDLVCHYLKSQKVDNTIPDALRWLSNMTGAIPSIKPVTYSKPVKDEPVFILKGVEPLKNIALVRYLEKRGIRADIAGRYASEVRAFNRETKKTTYAIGWKNEEGGYEILNRYFKGSVGAKDISFIRGTIVKPEGIHLFESWTDYVSTIAQQDGEPFKDDAIILNSVSLIQRATPYIKGYGYKMAYTWMDNDAAGRKATAALAEFIATEGNLFHNPMNSVFEPHKDVNAWHMHTLCLTL